MRTINSEGIVFGLLPKETQEEMKEAVGQIYMFTCDGWEKIRDAMWSSPTVYKVEIPSKKLSDAMAERINWLLDQHRGS